ncbi:MAG: GNAT family N-acetyltransferase [Anaerolineae bacterium]|nr:GNAT family N-acetyltransferase [Anaerolineae bacterium]
MTASSTITARPYRFADDFWRVRDLLIETYPITGLGFNWEIRRWDGSHFHDADPASSAKWQGRTQVWETAGGRIVGAAHPEGNSSGEAHLQIHPDYRAQLEPEMLDWAETHLAAPNAAGQPELAIFVFDYDFPRRHLLEARGYVQQAWGGVQRRMFFGERALPAPELAEGYTLHTLSADRPEDGDRLAALLNTAFNRDFHVGADFTNFARQAPCFREELHLAAVAPDGVFGAHVAVIYDEANRRALYEPVCTHPDHQRKGLARALMIEGLHRVKTLGALAITVETGDQVPANRLYEALGFTEAYKGYGWVKTW